MKKYIFLILCCIFHTNYSEQFVYPVADFDDGKQLMVIYQKSLENVELWIWDTTSQRAIKSLSSFLTPANLRMMPSGDGFSFIDRGYIKIKEFAKRSAKTLPIYEPIGLFSNMNWIDNDNFYFVAREGDFFQIFQGNLQANIQRLTAEPVDALYPQKIGETLFYIQRNLDCQVSIAMQSWIPLPMTISKDLVPKSVIIKESLHQLCYLHMISEREGFYLQAPAKKTDINNSCYEFECHHLIQKNNEWTTEHMFAFQIPIKYVTGLTRLYESLEPFLPNYNCKNNIYFVNWHNESEQFILYAYDIQTKEIENIVRSKSQIDSQQIFAPYIYQNSIYCGFITEDFSHLEMLRKKFEMNDVQIKLLHLFTKI